jgi:hypothetical protein
MNEKYRNLTLRDSLALDGKNELLKIRLNFPSKVTYFGRIGVKPPKINLAPPKLSASGDASSWRTRDRYRYARLPN